MLKTKSEERFLRALSYLPTGIAEEIQRIVKGRLGGAGEVREISIRADGRCTVKHCGENIPLISEVSPQDAAEIAKGLCEGALYAKRDDIASGFITVKGGIRVGICGYAKYDEGRLVGVSEIRSMLFRIPGHTCAFREELFEAYLDGIGSGMLIYSAPGVGKTTALRELAGFIGGGIDAKRVAVIDERCEFDDEDYLHCEVDILKGYKRHTGIEIACRTMSPSVIIMDEIGGEDAENILSAVKCGIPMIASAHASSLEELMSKPALKPLMDIGVFDTFVGISLSDGAYSLRVDRK